MDEVMDFDKYYDLKKDGSYVIHFPNNKGFSKTALSEMFSAYGKVLAIDNRGQRQGLCFIKYENLEDVKRCINGFKDHQYIKILAHKHKTKIGNTKTKSQNYRGNESKDYSKNQYQNNSQLDINMLKSTKNTTTSNKSIKDNEDFSDASLSSSVKTIDGDICSINKPSLKHLHLKHLRRSVLNKSSHSQEFSTDHSKELEQLGDIDEIPALISAEQSHRIAKKKFSVSSPMVIVAQEVIVANIHHSLSIHYILHLFEKYNPIAVSLMMTIPKSGIRYCHVYYKTSEDASATVEEFDKCLLRGKNLMVLTSQKLMQEVSLL
ncbi:uncharacterized protein LOC105663348 [Megachile rotundata]|uniref:uncharacterized protein LOC105663348 n=1 Tax=Megachile rotundata TaxID=143995 RepID=UPI003FD5BA04